MIFDYTSPGQIVILYEVVAYGSSSPVTGASVEDRIMAGLEFGVTREVTIGGFN